MSVELPPLPAGFPVKIRPEDGPFPHLTDWTVAYTADQMRAYARAAVDAALEAAAVKCEQTLNDYWRQRNAGMTPAMPDGDDCAAAIRAMRSGVEHI